MDYSQSVLEDIRAAAVDGLCRFPRGGVEIGGILLGSFRNGAVEVTAAQPVECSYANGPSYLLDAANEAAFRAALETVEGATVVGWYHSHTRSSLGFTAEDDAAHRRLFTDPRQIALVIRPESFGTAEAAFFLPAEQGIQEHAPASAVFAVRPAAGSPRDGASRRSLRPRHSESPVGLPSDAHSPQPPPVEASAHRLTVPGRLSRRRAELLAERGHGWDAEAARDAAPQPAEEMPVHGFVSEQGPASVAGTEQPVLNGFEAVLQPARMPLETPVALAPAFVEHPPEAQPALSEPTLEFAPEHASGPAEQAEQPLPASVEPPEEPPHMPDIETPASREAAPVHSEQAPAPQPALPAPQPRAAHRPLSKPAAEPVSISDASPVIPAFERPVPALALLVSEAPPAHIAPALVDVRTPPETEPLPAPDLQASPAIPVLQAAAPGPVFTAAQAHAAVDVSAPRLRPVPLPWAARAAAVAATVVLCIAALWYGLRPVHTVSNAPHLHLRVSESGGQLHITWDRNAIPLQTARNGTVTIRDGSRSITVPFAPEKLRAGGLTYARTSEEVEVRLRVDGPVPAEESIRLFGPPVNAPPAAPARTGTPAPKPTPVQPAVPAEDRLKLAGVTPPAAVPVEPRPRTDEPQQAAPTVGEAVPTRPFRPAAMPAAARSPAALPQPPNVQAAPQLASSAASAVVPSVAPPQPPRESPRPAPAYSGPIAGRLIWVGRLARGASLSIEGRRASMGIVTGELPGVPVRISAYPARLGDGELRVYASSPTVRGVREAAGPQNGWNPTVYSWDARRSSDVLVTEAPSPQNGWKGMSVRGNGGSVSVIVVDWRVAQP